MWFAPFVSHAKAFTRKRMPVSRGGRPARTKLASRRAVIEPLEERTVLSGGWLANTFPSDGFSSAEGRSVALDDGGNVYVAGSFNGTENFTPAADGGVSLTTESDYGSDDLFVAKLNPEGGFLWARPMGGPGLEHHPVMVVSPSGDVYVAGSFCGTAAFGGNQLTSAGGDDIFVTKLDTYGNFQWALRAGGPETVPSPYGRDDDHVRGIAVGSDGVYIAGAFRGSADFGDFHPLNQGVRDAFLAKVTESPDGPGFEWVQTSGTTARDGLYGVAIGRGAGGAEKIYTTFWSYSLLGEYVVTEYSPSGDVGWSRSVAINPGGQDPVGPCVYQEGPETYSIYTGASDCHYVVPAPSSITKLNMDGTVAFSVTAETQPADEGFYLRGLAADATGVYAAGMFLLPGDFDPDPNRSALLGADYNYDGFIWKLDHEGHFQAVRRLGDRTARDQGGWGDYAYGIALRAGDIYTTGCLGSPSALFDTGTALVSPSSVTSYGPELFVLKTTQDMGGVFGQVFNDLNGNGIQDTYTQAPYEGIPETPWPGATVYLDPNTPEARQTTTQAYGEYVFDHVAPGPHTVQLALPAGWTQTFGSAAYSVDIAAGSYVDACDFGAFHPTAFHTYRNSKATSFSAGKDVVSTIKIGDSYEIYDVAVNITVTATPPSMYLIGPDGTSVQVTAGSTLHFTSFNYKNVKGTWTLRIPRTRTKGAVTGWSLTILGPTSDSGAQSAAAAAVPSAQLADAALIELANTSERPGKANRFAASLMPLADPLLWWQV